MGKAFRTTVGSTVGEGLSRSTVFGLVLGGMRGGENSQVRSLCAVPSIVHRPGCDLKSTRWSIGERWVLHTCHTVLDPCAPDGQLLWSFLAHRASVRSTLRVASRATANACGVASPLSNDDKGRGGGT